MIRGLVRYRIRLHHAQEERRRRGARLFRSFDLEFSLNHILEHLGSHGAVTIDEFSEMLETDGLHLIAAAAFDEMGADGREALSRILDVMATRGVSQLPFRLGEAVVAIAREDGSVLPELIRRLRDGTGRMREAAAYVLGQMRKSAQPAAPDLLARLVDEDAATRSCAALALGQLGLQGTAVVDALIKAASDPEWSVRTSAVRSLGRIRDFPERVVPVLMKALEDEEGHDWTVQEAAVEALGEYGVQAKGALQRLREMAREEDEPSDFRELLDDSIRRISIGFSSKDSTRY